MPRDALADPSKWDVHQPVFLARSAGCGHETNSGDVGARKSKKGSAEVEAAKEFLKPASDRGLSLTGPDELLKHCTKNVLETALNQETAEHLGREKNRAVEGFALLSSTMWMSRAE